MIFEADTNQTGTGFAPVFTMPAAFVGRPPFDTLVLGAHEFYRRTGFQTARVILTGEEMAAVLRDEKTTGFFRYALRAGLPPKDSEADYLGAVVGFDVIVERRRRHEEVRR
jgi:hypothetical protein